MPLTASQRDKFLDLFWETYPELYEELHYKGITTSKLISDLKATYPKQFNYITNLWDYEEGYGA